MVEAEDLMQAESAVGGNVAKTGPSTPGDAFFQIAGLMASSPTHRHLFLADLEWLVLPPLMLQQFRIFRVKQRPVAFVSWAFLSEEAEARLQQSTPRLQPADWNSGDRAWIVDVVMPFGNIPEALKELKSREFQGREVKMVQMNEGRIQTVSV
mgnify:CR=1 FL=1